MFKPLDILNHLIQPFLLLGFITTFLPGALFSLLWNSPSSLLSLSKIQDVWFAHFWSFYGPGSRERASEHATPLIKLAHGIILEIGPGSGEWLILYDKSKVTKIYGVEPNADQHEGLRRSIKKAGLQDVYEIVPVGVEDLGEKWVGFGEVDCVVTIQCLCSIPTPRAMISYLYPYLANGGIWIVFEHVKTSRGGLIALYQTAIDVIWPHFVGGCSITRDTPRWLREAGKWKSVDLRQPEGEPGYQVLPHIMGVLAK